MDEYGRESEDPAEVAGSQPGAASHEPAPGAEEIEQPAPPAQEPAVPGAPVAGAYLEAEQPVRIDLNTATVDELRELPGIGPALAGRIVEYRTQVHAFEEPVEITAVPGISQAMYERIAGQLAVGPAQPDSGPKPLPEPAEVEPQPEPEVGVVEPQPEPEPARHKEMPVPEKARVEPPLVEVVSGPVGWGRLLFVALVSAVLGAVLALAALWLVNGTLSFRASADRALQAQVLRLDGEIGALDTQLGQLDGRLQSVEELSPRLDEAEADLQQLSGGLTAAEAELDSLAAGLAAMGDEVAGMGQDLSALKGQIGSVEEQLATVNEELRLVRQAAQRFDAFLTGLKELVDETAGLPSRRTPPATTPRETITPEATAWKTITPTPTSWEAITPGPTTEYTTTPSAMVTVIPLATFTPTPTP